MELLLLIPSAEDLEHVATTIALIVGGYWAWLRFIRRREEMPKAELEVFWRKTTYQTTTIDRLTIKITNKGTTALPVQHVRVMVQKLSPLTPGMEALLRQPRGHTFTDTFDGLDYISIKSREVELNHLLEPSESDSIHFDWMDPAIPSLVQVSVFLQNEVLTERYQKTYGWEHAVFVETMEKNVHENAP